jgi:hypothetical protein
VDLTNGNLTILESKTKTIPAGMTAPTADDAVVLWAQAGDQKLMANIMQLDFTSASPHLLDGPTYTISTPMAGVSVGYLVSKNSFLVTEFDRNDYN